MLDSFKIEDLKVKKEKISEPEKSLWLQYGNN